MRRVWAGLLCACWAGTATAEPPARPPAPAAPAGEVLIQKTAGQPERRLRLLSTATGPDGERLVDVQDVASGARYTLPGAALAGMKRAPAGPTDGPPPAAKPTAPARPAPSPGGAFPTSLKVPDPAPGSHSPFAARPFPPVSSEPKPRPKPPAADPPPLPWSQPTPPPAAPASPAALASAPAFDLPLPALVAPNSPPAEVVPAAEPPPLLPVRSPEPPPVQPAAAFAPAVASWQRTRLEQTRAETDPFVRELADALRPSVRERAASALAAGRHASHPAVKQALAKAAMTDPAPSVQAHCVKLLSALGYHASDYLEFLQASAGGPHPGLRQAAGAALAKLTPR